MANNDTNKKTTVMTVMKDKKVILSTVWIVALFNYLYADVFSLAFNPEEWDVTILTEGAMLGFAVLMETAIAMVLLSRVLKYRANRLTNIIVGIIHTALVIWSLSGETPVPYYTFFVSIEIACTVFIVWYAWRWRKQEA